ncbi:MAG: hypothetical protein H7Y38_02035 [Armatimonadetes bacterium]|nr:hypothetical protein [Armatimonadota bacterium]
MKRLLKQHAANTEPLFNGAGSLRGEARTVVNALDSMLSASECPPLSPARQELVLWLTEEARNGKNHALRRMVQSSVDDAPHPA